MRIFCALLPTKLSPLMARIIHDDSALCNSLTDRMSHAQQLFLVKCKTKLSSQRRAEPVDAGGKRCRLGQSREHNVAAGNIAVEVAGMDKHPLFE